ncbi:hypothetical protein [Amycolatopsis sp. RTGN1]|uniref:hypothetical protein n=1 Tax=Amycolatopsis ponsaeliensis TaxID=2992142 RepID=UPI00254ADD85|nr:hypothetical protein [Amycolatopsis sp. RTGN1]
MGITIDAGALDALFEATGGHAFLYRHLASAVVNELPGRHVSPGDQEAAGAADDQHVA